MKLPIDFRIPFDVFSTSAIQCVKRYVSLIEAQISQARSDEKSEGIAIYESLSNRDELDYEECVRTVERMYEEDFIPILRYTTVIYLYLVFETYVSRHVAEIERKSGGDVEILNQLKKQQRKENKRYGLVDVAEVYFGERVKMCFFRRDQWEQLREIAHLRHCIIHDGGVPRHSRYRTSIYKLERREWNGKPVGLTIDRCSCSEEDVGNPVNLEQRFSEYCLSVLEEFFSRLGQAADARFSKE